MKRRLLILMPGAVVAGVGLARCGASTAPGMEVTVRTRDFAFDPAPIRMSVGKPVRLVLVNEGLVEHDLVVRGLPARNVRAMAGAHGHGGDVAAHAPAGGRAWVEFTPTRAGTYEVDCTVPGHKEVGMRTTLVVG